MRAPRDFDATLPKRRKRLPAEPRLGLLGFHLRRTCWRAKKFSRILTLAKRGMLAGGLDGISPGKAISTFQTRMSLSNWLQL